MSRPSAVAGNHLGGPAAKCGDQPPTTKVPPNRLNHFHDNCLAQKSAELPERQEVGLLAVERPERATGLWTVEAVDIDPEIRFGSLRIEGGELAAPQTKTVTLIHALRVRSNCAPLTMGCSHTVPCQAAEGSQTLSHHLKNSCDSRSRGLRIGASWLWCPSNILRKKNKQTTKRTRQLQVSCQNILHRTNLAS